MEIAELSSLLRIVVSGLHKGLRKTMYSVKTYSMTEMETIVILARHAPLLPTELAAFTRVKTQSMSQILKKLERDGIVAREPSDKDKRKVYISLTNFGKKMVEKTKYERDEWLRATIEKTLNAKDRTLLEKTIPVLNKLLEIK